MKNRHTEWKSLRITLLLYIMVGLIPIAFYLFHSAFKEPESDTKVMHKVGWMEGILEASHASGTLFDLSPKVVKEIDLTFEAVEAWVETHRHSRFYLGGQTLQKDFDEAQKCWKTHKVLLQQPTTDHTSQCRGKIQYMALMIDSMINLKQRNMINSFYWSLALIMFFTLLLIYFVRVYIHLQMKKHAIHDEETGLFNQKYLFSVLHNACAESKRYHTPLCALWISVAFDSTADKKSKKQFYREFGTIVSGAIRSSDIAARCSDPASSAEKTLFCILLPMTSEAHGEVLANRLRETLRTKLSADASRNTLNFSIDAYDQKERCELFIERGGSALQ
ncbi:MAG: GGDEF domain-containing protein [Sulfurovum sp.]